MNIFRKQFHQNTHLSVIEHSTYLSLTFPGLRTCPQLLVFLTPSLRYRSKKPVFHSLDMCTNAVQYSIKKLIFAVPAASPVISSPGR